MHSESVTKYLVTDHSQLVVLKALQIANGKAFSIDDIVKAYDINNSDNLEKEKNKNSRKAQYRRAIYESRSKRNPSLIDRGFVKVIDHFFSHTLLYYITEEGQTALTISEICKWGNDVATKILLDDKKVQRMLEITRKARYVPTEILDIGIRNFDQSTELYESAIRFAEQKSETA